jgi:hypothetical protein
MKIDLDKIKVNRKPEVPDGFFDSFPDKILKEIPQEKTKTNSVVYMMLSMAACMLLFLLPAMFSNNYEDGLSSVHIKKEYFSENDALIAYLVEEEDVSIEQLITNLVDDGVEEGQFDEEQLQEIKESDIEEILLDDIDEDLIYEYLDI